MAGISFYSRVATPKILQSRLTVCARFARFMASLPFYLSHARKYKLVFIILLLKEANFKRLTRE